MAYDPNGPVDPYGDKQGLTNRQKYGGTWTRQDQLDADARNKEIENSWESRMGGYAGGVVGGAGGFLVGGPMGAFKGAQIGYGAMKANDAPVHTAGGGWTADATGAKTYTGGDGGGGAMDPSASAQMAENMRRTNMVGDQFRKEGYTGQEALGRYADASHTQGGTMADDLRRQGELSELRNFAQEGPGPSAAQAQLRAGTDANLAASMALAHSGRGAGDNVAAQRNAQFANADAEQKLTGQQAELRANEEAAWRAQKLNALTGYEQNRLNYAGLGNTATLTEDQIAQQQRDNAYKLNLEYGKMANANYMQGNELNTNLTTTGMNNATSRYGADRGYQSANERLTAEQESARNAQYAQWIAAGAPMAGKLYDALFGGGGGGGGDSTVLMGAEVPGGGFSVTDSVPTDTWTDTTGEAIDASDIRMKRRIVPMPEQYGQTY